MVIQLNNNHAHASYPNYAKLRNKSNLKYAWFLEKKHHDHVCKEFVLDYMYDAL